MSFKHWQYGRTHQVPNRVYIFDRNHVATLLLPTFSMRTPSLALQQSDKKTMNLKCKNISTQQFKWTANTSVSCMHYSSAFDHKNTNWRLGKVTTSTYYSLLYWQIGKVSPIRTDWKKVILMRSREIIDSVRYVCFCRELPSVDVIAMMMLLNRFAER